MAKLGYIFLSKNYLTKEVDIVWMQNFGCETIIEEDAHQEKLRPEWRKMLGRLKKGDTIVVTKFSHALRGIRELGVFLDLCRQYDIRIVSIYDRIDSDREIFPLTSIKDVLFTISTLSTEVNTLRRTVSRVHRINKGIHPNTMKAGLKKDREKTVVSMYNSGHSIDDIWKASGYKSRTSVFRVLNRQGVHLNRGRHQGPIKNRGQN